MPIFKIFKIKLSQCLQIKNFQHFHFFGFKLYWCLQFNKISKTRKTNCPAVCNSKKKKKKKRKKKKKKLQNKPYRCLQFKKYQNKFSWYFQQKIYQKLTKQVASTFKNVFWCQTVSLLSNYKPTCIKIGLIFWLNLDY